jgi:hypothetical protein
MAKAAFKEKKIFFHQHLTKSFCIAENWIFRKCRSEYLKVVQEKDEEDNLTDRMQNETVLYRIKEAREILNAEKQRKSNKFGHILSTDYLLQTYY